MKAVDQSGVVDDTKNVIAIVSAPIIFIDDGIEVDIDMMLFVEADMAIVVGMSMVDDGLKATGVWKRTYRPDRSLTLVEAMNCR